MLNRLTDRAFIDALSSGDKERMSDFIVDYFCVDPETDVSDNEEEEEPSKCREGSGSPPSEQVGKLRWCL